MLLFIICVCLLLLVLLCCLVRFWVGGLVGCGWYSCLGCLFYDTFLLVWVSVVVRYGCFVLVVCCVWFWLVPKRCISCWFGCCLVRCFVVFVLVYLLWLCWLTPDVAGCVCVFRVLLECERCCYICFNCLFVLYLVGLLVGVIDVLGLFTWVFVVG